MRPNGRRAYDRLLFGPDVNESWLIFGPDAVDSRPLPSGWCTVLTTDETKHAAASIAAHIVRTRAPQDDEAKAPSTPATTSKQHCRMLYESNNSFDKVETNWTCSTCFDFVERTKFYDKLVRHCCRFGNKVERCFDIVAGVDRALRITAIINRRLSTALLNQAYM